MVKQKRTVGAFVKIHLPDNRWAYARILEHASYAIYDLITTEPIEDVNKIAGKDILFYVSVYKDAITAGRWRKIGTLPLEDILTRLPSKFIQDPIDPNVFRLYDPNTGTMTSARKEDCIGLECAAVWEPEHVEERILDHYANRPNIWLEKMKIK